MPPYLANFPNFSPGPVPQLPGDVDMTLKQKLEKARQFAQLQREFDLYSWQMFLALNWPTDDRGRSAPRLEDAGFGAPRWTLWNDSTSIFRADGARPEMCDKPAAARGLVLSRNLDLPVSPGLPAFQLAQVGSVNHRTTRFLGTISAVGDRNVANLGSDTGQAFTGPLIDQNGNFVYYQIMIDPNEVGYLCENKLYNINGQVAFTGAGGKVDMPTGRPDQPWSGSFELKFAWKILLPGKDDFSRFFVQDAVVMDQGPDGKPVQRKAKVGMVGMHIGHKSETSPQWIWATFEQIDNLAVDAIAHPKLRASFNDPGCPLCAVNQEPVVAKDGSYPRTPVQVSRSIPIPEDKVALNAQVAAALGRGKSVWQYYQLIDTQWPTSAGTAVSAADSGLPQSVANKPGGLPTPVFLTNITMETYFQSGNQPACNQQEGGPGSPGCPAPYNSNSNNQKPLGTTTPGYTPEPAAWTVPLNNTAAPAKPGITTQIMGTESCMGCHSSAGVYKYDPANGKVTASVPLTADFSWLLSQKAQWFSGK